VYLRLLSNPQLFIEGNHRSGVLIMNLILVRAGLAPFILNSENAREYFDLSSEIKFTQRNTLGGKIKLFNYGIKFKRFLHCEDCKGTGFDKESTSDQCEICDGTGRNYGKTCEYCKGDGKVYTGQCKTCKGEKVTLKDTEVTLQNLFQIRDNLRNAHRGFGHQSKYYRERIGTLILNINVDRNDDFQIINNYDLSKTLDVHFQDAIDGVEIIYTHIDNNVIKIKLPAKSKNNDVIRVKEKGLLKNENLRGDLYLKINIIIDYERI
jgi:DnaJ-class molecular chaperone